MPVLSVEHLSKTYGAVDAVHDVSFSVRSGEIVALLGPNGAGKTTTISMILGVLAPTAGAIRIDGLDVEGQRVAALSRVNFAAVYAQLPGNLTVRQNLLIFALLYDIDDRASRIAHLLKAFELEAFADTHTGLLSSGEGTRVSLSKALLNQPRLLLLDEPTASLDPLTARTIRNRIRAYAEEGGGVLWTSHNMYEVEAVCDRVLFLSHGKILLEGDPKKLPAEHGKANLEELFIAVAHEKLSLPETV